MKPKFRSLIAAFAPLQRSTFIVCASLCAATAAHADQTWTGAGTTLPDSWTDAGSWSGAALPIASDIVNFNASSTANLNTFLDQAFTIKGITLVDPAGPVSISPINLTDILSIDSGGIDMSSAVETLTIGADVEMLVDQTWTNATDLTIGGVISDGAVSNAYSLTKAGAGTLTINGVSTYTGNTNVTEGILLLGNNSSITSPGVITLSEGTTLSIPQAIYATAGNSLQVEAFATADYTVRSQGGFLADVGAVGSGATLNLNLNFNGGITTFDRSWKFNSLLFNLNIVTQSGTQSQIRLRPNGGNFDTTSFADTDVSIDNTRIYVRSNSGGNTVGIGSLTGTATSNLSGGENGGVTYSIGRAGASDTVYSGIFSDNTPTGSWTNVIKTSTNSLTVGGDSTNQGSWDIVDGTLKFGEGGATGSPGTGAIIVDSDGVNGGQLVFDRTGAFTVAGIVSGTGPITLGGGADATFSNPASTFTGILTVNGGSITAGTLADGGLASSIGATTSDAANVVLNGATLGYNGTGGSTDRNFTIGTNGGGFGASGSGAVTFASTAALVLDGTNTPRTIGLNGTSTAANSFAPVIEDNGSGATSLSKSGAGNWDLTGVNTFSGGTTITEGTLTLSNVSGSATGTGAISVQTGGTLAGTGSASGTANVGSGGALVPGSNGVGTLTVGGLTLSSGSTTDFELQAGGPNDLVVTTVSGGLSLDGGAVNFYQPGTTNPVTAPGVYNLFQYSGTLGGSVGNLTFTEPVGTVYALGTGGGFVTLTVSAAALPNTWAATGSGNWSLGTNWTTGVPGGAGVIVNFLGAAASPSIVTMDGSRTAGGFLFDNVFGYTLAPGSGVLTLNNSGSPADVSVGTGDHSINVDVTLTAGMDVDTAASTSLTFGGVVSGTGGIAKNGDGLLVLNGSNLFSGGVAINAGSVQVGANSALGTDGLAFTANSSLVMGAANLVLANAVSIASGINGTVNTNGNNATLSNVISGDGVLVKSGAGVLSLTNTNLHTGGTVMNGGLIEFANAGNLGSGALSFNGGGLRWAPGNTLDPSTLVTDFLAGGGILDTNGNNVTVAGQVGGTGVGRLIKQGAGTMTLSFGQTFQGGVSVLGGTLAIDDVTAFGTVPAVVTPGNLVINNGTLQTTGSLTTALNRGITVGGTATVAMTNPADIVTLGGAIAGTGLLSLQGGGTWFLNQPNGYTGGTTVTGGTVHLASGASFGTGLLTLDGTSFIQDGTDNPTFTLANAVNIPAGKTSSMSLGGRHNLNGAYTAATNSTLNVDVRFVRDAIGGNWIGFLGQLNITATQTGNGEFRLNSSANNLGNAKVNIGAGVLVSQIFNPPSGSGTQTIQNIGELSGVGTLSGQPVSGRFVNWTVGGLGTNSVFDGVIQNAAGAARLTKVGVGSLTLTNVNTYTGYTSVQGGSLILGAAGSIDNSTDLILGSAGVLDTTAKASFAIPATQLVTFNVTGLGSGASGRINATGKTLDISAAVANFTIGDPLDDAVYILADYGTLTGSGTASFTPPVGYAIDFAYNGGTQIALVQSASDYDTWAASYLPVDVTNMAGDNDNDGLTNQQEYAFGLSPVDGSSVNPILVQLSKTAGTFTYQRRNPSLTGLTYTVWTSPDLVTWTPDLTAAETPTDIGDNQSVAVTLTGAPLTATKLFVRVAAD